VADTDIDWDDVVEVAADLANPAIPVEFQTDILDYVNRHVHPGGFNGENSSTYKLARAYLAAHFGLMQKNRGTGGQGPVTSKSEGGVSISYATTFVPGAEDLAETAYGRAFLSFSKRSIFRAGFTV
jgi:hypothetical protein